MDRRPACLAAELLAGARLFLVSNRGPLSIVPDDDAPDGLAAARGPGGLVTALGGIAGSIPVTWVATALGPGDRLAAQHRDLLDRIVRDALPGQDLRLVLEALPEDVYERHYRVFANPFLWFLQHGLTEEARKLDGERLLDAWRAGYVAANERMAAATIRAIAGTPRPVVWVHDYQLYLVSRRVRAARPDATLAHFSHIPWPAPEAWSILPRTIVAEIIGGLLANDVVAFQTLPDVRRFMATVAAVTGRRIDPAAESVRWDGRTVMIRARPISLEPAAIRATAASPEVERMVARLRRELVSDGDPRLIVRVDRLDPTKNALRGFLAFEELLRGRPDLRGRVRFLAVMAPSRVGLEAYDRYAHDVEQAIRRIVASAGDAIRVDRDGGYERALAALRLADVVLVNSVADGMNLVAKEAALVGERDPAIVLSSTAGAARELGPYALAIEPLDVAGTAAALERALAMSSAERTTRARAMRLIVESRGIEHWLAENLSDMLTSRRATLRGPLLATVSRLARRAASDRERMAHPSAGRAAPARYQRAMGRTRQAGTPSGGT